MKRINPVSLVILLTFPLFFACNKNYSDEQYIPDDISKVPDLTVKMTASVNGYVVDENNNPVAMADVVAGDKKTQTDEYGYFALSNASLSKAAGLVKASKEAYFTSYRTFEVHENKEAFMRLQLLTKTNTGSITAAAGGTISSTDGVKVELPANGIVTAAGSNSYSGTVKVAVRWIDPASTDNLQLSSPGDSRGIDKDGRLKFARSFGAIAVELTGDAGQLLQIASGKQAVVNIPIPAAIASAAPATIALWSFNESTGLWKEESTATRNGNTYTGNVSHFSYWEGATALPVVNFTARILNTALQPLANVPVLITRAGLPWNSGYGRFCHTDANGYVYGAIPANSSLVLDVLTPCVTSAYSHNFSAVTSDVDMGVITGNLGQGMVTLTGTVKNCDNAPVTDGYVQIYDNGFYNRIPIINGSFSFTGTVCTNTTVHYVAIDNITHQQNVPQSISLVPGVNNLGLISACGTSTLSTLSYTIDGTTKTFNEPTAQPTGIHITPQNIWTQVLVIGNGQSEISFQFDGGPAVGDIHKVTEVFSTGFKGQRGVAPVPLKVNITEFGKQGGFIAGNFSGLMLDFVDNIPYTVSCNFRVRRIN